MVKTSHWGLWLIATRLILVRVVRANEKTSWRPCKTGPGLPARRKAAAIPEIATMSCRTTVVKPREAQ